MVQFSVLLLATLAAQCAQAARVLVEKHVNMPKPVLVKGRPEHYTGNFKRGLCPPQEQLYGFVMIEQAILDDGKLVESKIESFEKLVRSETSSAPDHFSKLPACHDALMCAETETMGPFDTSDGSSLGLELDESPEQLKVTEILSGGLVDTWNKNDQNPKILEEDCIVEVNGRFGDPKVLLEKMKQKKPFFIKVTPCNPERWEGPCARDAFGRTLLHVAADFGSDGAIKALLAGNLGTSALELKDRFKKTASQYVAHAKEQACQGKGGMYHGGIQGEWGSCRHGCDDSLAYKNHVEHMEELKKKNAVATNKACGCSRFSDNCSNMESPECEALISSHVEEQIAQERETTNLIEVHQANCCKSWCDKYTRAEKLIDDAKVCRSMMKATIAVCKDCTATDPKDKATDPDCVSCADARQVLAETCQEFDTPAKAAYSPSIKERLLKWFH